MKPLIFIDFDGTIVDVWSRYFKVIKDFFNLPQTYFSTYKRLKYLYPNDRDLISLSICSDSKKIEEYLSFKRKMLENIEYLQLDSLLVEPAFLKEFFLSTGARVLTSRQNNTAFFEQLELLGISFLKDISVIIKPSGPNSKRFWLETNFPNCPIIIAGDSETDLNAGNLPESKAFFIKTGLRNIETMPQNLNICNVYENISDFFNEILEKSN